MAKRLKPYKSIQSKTILDGITKEIENCEGKLKKISASEVDLMLNIEKLFKKTMNEVEESLPLMRYV